MTISVSVHRGCRPGQIGPVLQESFMQQLSRPTAKSELTLVVSIFLFAILTRIAIPPFFGHPANFSPLNAIALFCGTCFHRRFIAFIIAILAAWLGDVLLSKLFFSHWVLFYPGCYWQYTCYALITALGFTLKFKITPLRLVSASLASSLLFFIISNLGVWLSGLLYPFTLTGLINCYLAAIPFFQNTLLSDLFFSIILFGCFKLLDTYSHNPFLKPAKCWLLRRVI